jgi:hypothetical protein
VLGDHAHVSGGNTKQSRDENSNLSVDALRLFPVERAPHFRDYSDTLSPKLFVIYTESHDPARIDPSNLRSDSLDIFGKNVLTSDDDNVLHASDHV